MKSLLLFIIINQSIYGEDEVGIYSGPGRSEICGNHTDHNHGFCLVANSNLRVKACFKKIENKIKIKSKGYSFFEIDLKHLDRRRYKLVGPALLCKGIAYKLKKDGYKVGGFEAYIQSDLPTGAGVSSSAAFEALIGNIINYLYNDNSIPKIEIAKSGQYAENVFYGKPCGLLDQIGTNFDGINFIDFLDKNNPKIESINFDLPLSIYLIKSCGSHSGLKDLYSFIPKSMKYMAYRLGHKKYLRSFADNENILDRIDSIKVSDITKNIAKHFFIECENVNKCKNAILNNDLDSFLKCIEISQKSSKENLKNTYIINQYKNSPQFIIDSLNSFLLNNGAVRIHGGGFKGTVICFVKKSFEKEFETNLRKRLGNFKSYKVDISNKAVNFETIK